MKQKYIYIYIVKSSFQKEAYIKECIKQWGIKDTIFLPSNILIELIYNISTFQNKAK